MELFPLQVLPSPTTGQFLFAPGGNNRAVNPDDVKENTFQDVNASSFTFRPVAESAQFPYFNSANKVINLTLDTFCVLYVLTWQYVCLLLIMT